MESLLVPLSPIPPERTVNEVAEIFLQEEYRRFLCLPVVDQGRPLGVISRDELQGIFVKRYGRELVGTKPVTAIMNARPLTVEMGRPMDEVSQYITANVRFPITEDFVITRNGEYLGVGHVVDLLRVMQNRLDRRNDELAKAYQRLKSSQSQLVQSEKMASLGQMVAGVAHEINTPLGYVKNNIGLAKDLLGQLQVQVLAYEELLDKLTSGEAREEEIEMSLGLIGELKAAFQEGFSPEDVEALFSDTLYGVDQISEIVLNLKDFSRLDQAPAENVNLNQCVESALLIARNVLKHKAEVVRELGDLPVASCAPSQINQVLLNLLTNAAHAIEGQGRIVVRTYADEKFLHAEVQDNGRGIAEAHLSKIFDPFFTTKPAGQGTGLGLSIAYRIMKNHGGLIRVASREGVGTKFCISLPRQPKALN